MNYLIRTKKKSKVLSTDLPKELIDEAVNCNKEFEIVQCKIRKEKKRQGIIDRGNLVLYLCSYDTNKTNKIFKHQIRDSTGFLKAYETMSEEERKKTRKLKHNLSTYTTKIYQELFKLLPQDKVSGGHSNQREVVRTILEKNPDHAVTTLLRILKNANLIKSEFDVYDIMHTPNPHIDLHKHSIHKVITLSLSPFWLDFIDKKISVNMDKCDGMMNFDYKSMSSILCHIFDNATKYVAHDSEFKITVIEHSCHHNIIFDMISLRVKKDELEKIFEYGFSSNYSERLGYAGEGVGMNVIKNLSELNGFKLNFENNVDPSKSINKLNIPFEHNKLTIGIPKESS